MENFYFYSIIEQKIIPTVPLIHNEIRYFKVELRYPKNKLFNITLCTVLNNDIYVYKRKKQGFYQQLRIPHTVKNR